MANGWGGRRAGSGPKRNKTAAATPAAESTALVATEDPKPKRRVSWDSVLEVVKSSQRTARRRPRTKETSPFQIALHPKSAMPPERLQMAQDDALNLTNDWATSAWMQGGLAVAEGMQFLGYPLLSELAQRPEYRTISETIATEMTRKWIRFKAKGDVDKSDKISELVDFLDDLKLRDRFSDVALNDGFFGRGHIFLDPGDVSDEELKTPIGNGRDETTKGKVSKQWLKGLRVIEPIWVYPTTYNAQNPLRPDWYDPQVWYVMGKEIHRSRLPTFIGRPVPDLLKPAYSFGGLSMSQMAKPYIDIWLQTRESVADLIHSFSIMVLSTDLSTRLQADTGGAGDLMARVALFNALRDNQGMFVVNKETEDFKNVSATLSGLEALQAQSQEHIMSVARIPAVKYTGLQPLGLNASSEGEMRAFHETIHAFQEYLFGPNLDFIIDVAMISLWGERDVDIVHEWVPLWSMSEKEEAELRKTEAETGQILIDSGVISQEEERGRIANDPATLYPGLDPDDVPDLAEEEAEGLQPGGKKPGGGEGEGEERGGEDAARPFAGASDADWSEGDHPRAPDGKFGAGSSGSPHEGKSGKFVSKGTGNLAAQGFQPRKRGSGSDVTQAMQVAWHVAQTSGKPQTVSVNNLGFFLLKPGDKIPHGHPHIVVQPNGDVTRYQSAAITGDDVSWSEEDHPRAPDGKFGKGSGKTTQVVHAPQFGIEHGKFTAGHGSPHTHGLSPKARSNVGAPIDVSKLEKVGKQMGSNPGGVYRDAGGKEFYVKKGKSADHVRNEMIAAALYDLAGTPTLQYRPVEGGTHVATEIAKLDKDNASKLSKEEVREARRDFVVHAWLANWDAVGLGGDNLGTVRGVPTALDLGGALSYRAQGAPKGKAFGDKVGEISTLRDPNMNPDAAGIFGGMSVGEMRESARYVTSIRDERIRKTVEAMGGGADLADKLIARKADIADQARYFGAQGKPADPTSTVVIPAGEEAPIKKLNGIAFTRWRPPADWAAVDGQIDIDEPDLDLPKGKKASSGVMIRESDGRVWIVQPRGGYGGYEATFPKGNVEEGLSMQANAIKEAWEESGLKVRITGHAADLEGDVTMTRYYFAEREGGDPGLHQDETEGVVLAPKDKLSGFLNRDRDRKLAKMATDDFNESKHPRDPDGKFAESGSGGGAGEGEPNLSLNPNNEPSKQAPYGGLYHTGGSSAKENHAITVHKVLSQPVKIGIHYRRLVAALINEAPKFGGPETIEPLKKKLVEALFKAQAKALAAGDEAGSKKLIEAVAKIEKASPDIVAAAFIKSAGGAGIQPPKTYQDFKHQLAAAMAAGNKFVAENLTKWNSDWAQELAEENKAKAAKPAAAKFPPPTEQELAKAKKTVPLQLQYVPGAPSTPAAQKMVDEFNGKWAGKEVTSQSDLIQKVNDFKAMQAKMAPLAAQQQAEASAQAAAIQESAAKKAAKLKVQALAEAKANAEKNKAVMQQLGITEQEAEGFGALVKMMGKSEADVVAAFKGYEDKAKAFGYPITGFQAALIQNYTGSGYGAINKALRSGAWSVAQHVYVKLVNKALREMPTYKGIVKRGVSLDEKQQATFKVGHVRQEHAFTSSSTTTPWSGNTQITITAIGKHGADVKKLSHHPGENEVVFAARTFFKVTKVESKDGVLHVAMEEMEE